MEHLGIINSPLKGGPKNQLYISRAICRRYVQVLGTFFWAILGVGLPLHKPYLN